MIAKDEIGNNARHVEQLLTEKGPLPLRALADLTNLGETLLFAVLGWLSNESKIRFYSNKGMLYAELNAAYSG